jgi:hypothetical protein
LPGSGGARAELSDHDMDLISGLNRDERIGFDPDTFNGLNRR